MSVLIAHDYTVASGSTVNITANTIYYFSTYHLYTPDYYIYPGFIFNPNPGVVANTTIAGTANVTSSSDTFAALFVQSSRYTPAGLFHITDTGTLNVVSTNTASDAVTVGIFAPFQSIDVVNDGLISVKGANGTVIGIYSDELSNEMDNHFSLTNNGMLQVSGGTSGAGVIICNESSTTNSAYFNNSGTIDVSGSLSAVGVDIEMVAGIDFVNTGGIEAQVDPGSPYAAIGVYVGLGDAGSFYNAGPVDSTFINEGQIAGDYSFFVEDLRPRAETLINHGEMIGAIVLDTGNDVIFNDGAITGNIDLGVGDDSLLNAGAMNSNVELGMNDDLFLASTSQAALVDGASGNDRIFGGAAGETLLGGFGEDQISGGAGDDLIDGGRGADSLDGGAGRDALYYYDSTMGIVADLAAGTVFDGANDKVRNFEALIATPFDDQITGSARAEMFQGMGGADAINGGGGADTLVGGSGDDALTGGSGNDWFAFSAGDGHDVITDFVAGGTDDSLHIYGYTGYQQLVQNGTDVVVVLSASDSIILKNVQVAQLTSADFVFNATPLDPEPSAALGRIVIEQSVHFSAGETIHIVTSDTFFGHQHGTYAEGIDISRGHAGDASMFNDAHVVIEGDTPSDTTISLQGITYANGIVDWVDGMATNPVIVNGSGGLIEVINHGGSSDPADLGTSGIYGYQFWNQGTLSVSAERGDAAGYGGSGLINTGVINVTSNASALGATLDFNSNSVDISKQGNFNYGQINVSGAEASYGVDYNLSGYLPGFVNAGSITVTDHTAAIDSVGILLHGGVQTVWNSGTVTADYAITYSWPWPGSNTSFNIYNSGTLNGNIQFCDGEEYIRNTGTINGDVFIHFDTLEGENGSAFYDGRGGHLNGTLYGGYLGDRLYGGVGVEHIHGGHGDDLIAGGKGADVLAGDQGSDQFFFQTGDGADTILDFQAGLSGDVLLLRGYSSYQSLEQIGADTLVHLSATDSILLKNVTAANLTSANFAFNAAALEAPLAIPTPDAAPTAPSWTDYVAPDVAPVFIDNVRYGTAGADIIVAGSGADLLVGLGGDDVYQIANSRSEIVELPDGGTDTIKSAGTVALPDNVENLTIFGTAAANGTGNDLDNIINGNSASNKLTGGAGDDTLRGGDGSDTLDGGLGDDVMYGGLGNDTFIVDSVSDVVHENNGEGTDLVKSSVDYALLAGLENLTLTGPFSISGTGNTLANIIIGNDASNVLKGGAGNDTLKGGAGWDLLDGGIGDDAMYGGTDNDTYVVNSALDTVYEYSGQGTDLVQSSVSYSLGPNLENLTLTGTAAINGTGNSLDNTILGNTAANTLMGQGGADTLKGDAGADWIDGGGGADALYGGTGNDTFVVDNVGDQVFENASEGADTVRSSVSFALGSDIENLTLTGIAAIDGTGNGWNNTIVGNSAANTLIGWGGADVLQGGGGADTLTGGTGLDKFVYTSLSDSLASASDRITDLATGDKIDLSAIDADDVLAGDQAFVRLAGDGAFTAAGQLRLTFDGTYTHLDLNTDADAAAEAVILIAGNHTEATATNGWVL